MISLIRTMLGNALKTNNSLKFAVLTGCLRITKESVFTGLNNFKIYSNTSGNAIVRRFIDMAGAQTRNEMEDLIAGKSISKDIHQELTYNELDQSIENLWSVLFTTGYLTTKSGIRENPYQLMIPNQEIRGLFIDQIRIWFKETSRANKETISTFCSAFPERNAAVIKHLHRLKTSNMPPAWKKTA